MFHSGSLAVHTWRFVISKVKTCIFNFLGPLKWSPSARSLSTTAGINLSTSRKSFYLGKHGSDFWVFVGKSILLFFSDNSQIDFVLAETLTSLYSMLQWFWNNLQVSISLSQQSDVVWNYLLHSYMSFFVCSYPCGSYPFKPHYQITNSPFFYPYCSYRSSEELLNIENFHNV